MAVAALLIATAAIVASGMSVYYARQTAKYRAIVRRQWEARR